MATVGRKFKKCRRERPSRILRVGEACRLDAQPPTSDGLAYLAEIRHLSPHAVGWKILIALPQILVVDDDPVVCELLTYILPARGIASRTRGMPPRRWRSCSGTVQTSCCSTSAFPR